MAVARTRDESVALIAEHLGVTAAVPGRRAELLQRAFHRYGWTMVTDEAVAFISGWCESERTWDDRMDEARRRLADEGAAERAMARAQRETGDLLAEAFPIVTDPQQKDAA